MSAVTLHTAESVLNAIEALRVGGHPIQSFAGFGFGTLSPGDQGNFPYIVVGLPTARVSGETCLSEDYVVVLSIDLYDFFQNLSNNAEILEDCLKNLKDTPHLVGDQMRVFGDYDVTGFRFTGGSVSRFDNDVWRSRTLGEVRVARLK